MNLTAYDNIQTDYNEGTWIDPAYKKFYTTNIPYRKYCILLKRFNSNTHNNDYYMALTDIKPNENIIYHLGFNTRRGIFIINFRNNWNNNPLSTIKEKTKINIHLEEKQEDGEIYYLDI